MTRPVEGRRRLVHFSMGGLAFLLKYLTLPQASLCAGGAVLFNRFLLPRIGPGLFRPAEEKHPWRSGIVIYPIAVLVLLVLFGDRMEVAAAGWVIMAAGDAAAGYFGRRYGGRSLPWNRGKSWAGSGAFVFASTAASWAVLAWMGRRPVEAALLAVPTGFFAAFVEALPWRLDDNLTVPILGSLFLRGLLEVSPQHLLATAPALRDAFVAGALANLALAWAFGRLRLVDRSGAVAGFLVGLLTWTFAGWRGYLILTAFFALGSGATRLGRRRKERAGVAQEKHGARSARHALANCGVAVFLGLLLAASPFPGVFVLAFVCAYATAAFDTVSSEIGQAYGGRPVLITTLRAVPVGTNGAVTWIGTLAGLAASLIVAGLASATGFLSSDLVGIVSVAAFIGSTADSILGATLETRGLMDNDAVNFSNTLIGALSGIGIAALVAAPV